MKNRILLVCLAIIFLSACENKKTRIISVKEYQSKMKAGWLGQMAGVGQGASTEFKFNGMIIPEEEVPVWNTKMINQQWQDDIYVEMTFLKTLEDYGFDVSIRQAGIDFANSEYQLWHANKFGRDNLRAGIAPPYSGHPKYNAHADDIDYQIEADYSGLIAPGMPQTVIDLADKFGRIMNYGDGVYGGIFVGAMYAEAFFETDMHKIIEAGLACIPTKSQFAEAIRDVIQWHAEYPKDWQKTWRLIEDKYNLNPEYRKFSCSDHRAAFNIDAKINAAYITMGLLYGEGNMDKTIVVSMRCGQDSDCNPSNAAGILATSMGMENLPKQYQTNIDETTNFSFTAYNFPSLINVCETLAKQAVLRSGGKIAKNTEGIEEMVIPIQLPTVPEMEQSWEASEITNDVKFTEEEMAQIIVKIRSNDDLVNIWQVAGPFSKEEIEPSKILDEIFEPETNSNYKEWQALELDTDDYTDGMIDLYKMFPTNNAAAYMKAQVYTEVALDVNLEMGSDDGLKVWLNNKEIHNNNIFRGHAQASDVVPATLDKGWNVILMKVSQGTQGWGASLVISDEDRKLIEGLKFK